MIQIWWLSRSQELGIPKTRSWWLIAERLMILFVISKVIRWIDRRKNEAADALSRLGSQHKPVPPNIFLDVLNNPSVKFLAEEDPAIPDPEA